MSRFLRSSGLVVLAVATLVLIYLALTRDMSADNANDSQGPGATEPVGEPSASASADPDAPPEVADQVRADFGTSGQLPAGARTYDNPAAGSPLKVTQGFLTHDPGKAPVSIGSLEVQLPAPVQKIGATIVFPLRNGGTVNVVAWASSLVDARGADQPVPDSGLRLIASSSDWQLTTYYQGESVIAGDQFDPVPGPQTFEVYRADATAWVVDPTGAVTKVDNPLLAKLAGPWACWQVAEDRPSRTPARIQEIWAG